MNASLPASSRLRIVPRTGWVVALLLPFAAAACLPAYETRLQAYRDRGDLAAATALLDETLAADPQNSEALRERGIVAIERGESSEAVPMLERVLEREPEDARAAFYLALAVDDLERWDEAVVRYDRVLALDGEMSDELRAGVIRQRHRVEQRRVTGRVERALAGDYPTAGRTLFLPFDVQTPTPLARDLRLGLAALLIRDWRRVPAAPPVPLAEVMLHMTALGIADDGTIDGPTRERLALLTGADLVVFGRISETGGTLTLEPRVLDRRAGAGGEVTPIEYLRGRAGTFLDLEKTILFRTVRIAGIELTEERTVQLRRLATDSPLALQLYGRTLALVDAGEEREALASIQDAIEQDPDFELAVEAAIVLDPGLPRAVAGEIDLLRGLYEQDARLAEQAALRNAMLARAQRGAGVIGGPEGEGKDLSINRPAAAGSAGVSVRFPR